MMQTSQNGSGIRDNQCHPKPKRSKWLVGAIVGIGSIGLGAAFLTGYYTRTGQNSNELAKVYAELISVKQALLEEREKIAQSDHRDQKENRLHGADTVDLETLFMNTGTKLIRAIKLDLEWKIRDARNEYNSQSSAPKDERNIPDLKESITRRYTPETLQESIKNARVILDDESYVDQQGDLIRVDKQKQTEEIRVRGFDIMGETTDVNFPLALKTRDQHYIASRKWYGMHLMDHKGKLLIADARHLLRQKEDIYEVVEGKTRKVKGVNLKLYDRVVSDHNFIRNLDMPMGYSAIAHLFLQQPRIFFDEKSVDMFGIAYRDLFDLALSQDFGRKSEGLYTRVKHREIK